jgi:hypothetical protein
MRLDAWDQNAAIRYDQQLWNELASLRFLDVTHGCPDPRSASAKPTLSVDRQKGNHNAHS